MAGVLKRLVGFLQGGDEALNALSGGRPRETMSGSIGRALLAGRWWAPIACAVVNTAAMLLAGQQDHCQVTAANEQRRRDLEAAG